MVYGENITYDVVLAVLSLSIFFLGILLFILWKEEKKDTEKNENVEDNPPVKHCALPYTLMDIDAATDGFNNRRIIGKGRLGTVYAAVMPRGELVAVKRIHSRHVLSDAGFGFSSVVKWLSLAHHSHIVPILGFSQGPGERIIVMEFVGMMSLEFYLHQNYNGAGSLLDWAHRLSVAAGVARGLEYLHEVVAPPIVHGCVKPSNVLIDVKLCARVCDFGLSFLAPEERQGLVGYVDEEYWVDKKGASKESDMYGFGVVLLELLSGRMSEDGLIVKWALPLIKEMKMSEFLDPRLVIPCDIKPLIRLAKVASACVGNSRKNRPSIVQIVAILNNLEDSAMYLSNGSLQN